MGVSLGGPTTFRFVYCHHPEHEEDEPCLASCLHDPGGCRHDIYDDDRDCKRCGDTVATLSTDNLCDGCVAEDDHPPHKENP